MNLAKFKNKSFQYACILTTGRTGSDFLQGCLDGVPGIITFSGEVPFYKFLEKVEFDNILKKKKYNLLITQFIKNNKNLFYQDNIENKKINLNLKKFKLFFLKLSKNCKMNKKIFFKNLYLSYHLTLNRKIYQTNLILHHAHNPIETEKFMKDFDNSKLLVTIRNPFHNLKSGISNWVRYDKKKKNFEHFYLYVRRIREDLDYALTKKKVFFVKLEDMGKKSFKKSILKFLNINYSKLVNISTFAGKPWRSDKLSRFKRRDGLFDRSVLQENWDKYYFKKDLLILRYLYSKYKIFGYNVKNLNIIEKLILPLLFLLPMKFEIRMIGSIFSQNSKKSFLFNIYYYCRKIIYFYRVYLF